MRGQAYYLAALLGRALARKQLEGADLVMAGEHFHTTDDLGGHVAARTPYVVASWQ